MKIILMCAVIAIAASGCSAKQKANFEEVTGDICKQVREIQAEVALGTAVIPNETVKMALGLTYLELLAQCAILDQLPPTPETNIAWLTE